MKKIDLYYHDKPAERVLVKLMIEIKPSMYITNRGGKAFLVKNIDK